MGSCGPAIGGRRSWRRCRSRVEPSKKTDTVGKTIYGSKVESVDLALPGSASNFRKENLTRGGKKTCVAARRLSPSPPVGE